MKQTMHTSNIQVILGSSSFLRYKMCPPLAKYILPSEVLSSQNVVYAMTVKRYLTSFLGPEDTGPRVAFSLTLKSRHSVQTHFLILRPLQEFWRSCNQSLYCILEQTKFTTSSARCIIINILMGTNNTTKYKDI